MLRKAFSSLGSRVIASNRAYKSHAMFSNTRPSMDNIPRLDDFIKSQRVESLNPEDAEVGVPSSFDYTQKSNLMKKEQETITPKFFHIETYGCQMNESDTEIVNSILRGAGYLHTPNVSDAHIVLLNTCAIRENAEMKIWNRLNELKAMKSKAKKNAKMIVGVLGCMAERLKDKLVEKNKTVDLIVGPDAYRDIPRLLEALTPEQSNYGINVQLSMDETYADISPVRMNPDSVSAYVSIMRGCNNMCAFCIVPFTRGRERSRPVESIVEEVKILRDQNVKEITLLGQNVNSYFDTSDTTTEVPHENAAGFGETFKLRKGSGARFATLLEKVAEAAPEVRFRFTSPHPKDFPDSVIEAIATHPNICKNIHMPAQSGNSEMLRRMRRHYTREAYIELVNNIRQKVPDMTFSSDFIAGFCGETEEEFKDTLTLIEKVKYEIAFLFAYSLREKTYAHRNLQDDVPEDVKKRRLEEMIDVFLKNQLIATQKEKGRYHLVLVEGESKQGNQWKGRTDTNRVCILDTKEKVLPSLDESMRELISKSIGTGVNDSLLNEVNQAKPQYNLHEVQKGDFVLVRVHGSTSKTLFATPLARTTISEFFALSNGRPCFE